MLLSLTVVMVLAMPADESKQSDRGKDAGTPVKILGRASWRASTKPGAAAQQIVIRSEADFAKAVGAGNDAKAALDDLKKQMKVEQIDWQKQMLIVVAGGAQRTGGYRLEVLGAFAKGNTLTVQWKLHSPKPTDFVTMAFTHPAEAVLVESTAGKVVFDPPAPKPEGKPGKGNSKKPDPSE